MFFVAAGAQHAVLEESGLQRKIRKSVGVSVISE